MHGLKTLAFVEKMPGLAAIGAGHRRRELSEPRSTPSCLIAVALIARRDGMLIEHK